MPGARSYVAFTSTRIWLAALACALALPACRKTLPPELSRLELSEPPAKVPIALHVELGSAIELIGAKVTPTEGLQPGSRVEVTLYWRRLAALDDDFRLFTHVVDAAGERLLNLDNIGQLRRVDATGAPRFPPSAWTRGKVYVDEQAFWVPVNVLTDTISVVCGLYRGDERLPVTRGAAPGDRDRVRVVTLDVHRRLPAVSPVPVLWVPRRRPGADLVIDGKLDDAGWQGAASSGPFVDVATGEAVGADEVGGSVKLVYDQQWLYLGFDVLDDDLRGGFDPASRDPHLWLRDTVEVMLDPDGDGDNRDYYEIQVGPQNLVFDSQFDAYNLPHVEPNGPFGHQEWSSGLKSAVVLHGTLDDQREDDGYTVEMAIPWASFTKAKRVPPAPDDTWRMNFYAVEHNSGSAWSPILGQGNFHKASRFGRVRFSPPRSTQP